MKPHLGRRPPIPIVYAGQEFPSRQALARHLVPIVGKTLDALNRALSRHDGNVERVLGPPANRGPVPKPRPAPKPIPVYVVFEGRAFSSRRAFARHLADELGRRLRVVEWMLQKHHDDVPAAVAALAARRSPPGANVRLRDAAPSFMPPLRRRRDFELLERTHR
jgi:hypothetical protein